MGKRVQPIAEPEQVEQLACPPIGRPTRRASEHRRDRHVLCSGHRVEQVEELEDDADRRPAMDGPGVAVQRAHLRPGDDDGALVGDVEAGDDRQQRRLAAPRRTGDGDELACRDGQVDAAQGAHRRRVAVERPLEVPDLDDR